MREVRSGTCRSGELGEKGATKNKFERNTELIRFS
jgi:hypothetical protein